MATAKLWWNGSSWSTSSANWFNQDKTGNNQLGLTLTNQIVAYDDFTIKMSQGIRAYQTASIYWNVSVDSPSIWAKSGSTNIGANNFTNADVTNYTSFSTSGSAWAMGAAGTSSYSSGQIYFSGSTTISSPFYIVSYNANGGTDAPEPTKTVKGFAGVVTESIPTRANHVFLGWATSDSAHVSDYSSGDSITPSGDTTLYAVWMPTVFITADEGVTITFNGVAYTNQSATVTGLTWGNEYALLVTPNAGWIVKTQSHPNGNVEMDADEITITATGQRVGCHIDDGNEFVQAVMYMDTGNDWQMVQAYYDNGNSWELVY